MKHYEGYIIYEDGRIYSDKSKLFLSQQESNGYKFVVLMVNNKPKRFCVHRLVAKMYHLNPNNKPCVNHINGIRSDNHKDNLEWVTISTNIKHSYDSNGRMPALNMLGKKHSKDTKDKMSESKIGDKHPKFKGYYIYNNGNTTYRSVTPKELIVAASLGVSGMTVLRKCKANKDGFSFEPTK